MKNFSLFIISIFFLQNMDAQNQKNRLIVYTHDSLAVFQLYVDGNRLNSFHVDSIAIEDIDSVMLTISVSFKDSTFADKTEEVSFIETQERIYEIVAKPGFMQRVAKGGRNIGKQLKIGKHGNEENLYDVYYLKDKTVLEQYKK